MSQGQPARRGEAARLILLHAGVLAVLAGGTTPPGARGTVTVRGAS